MAETFLTVEQAAGRLLVNHNTLRGWIKCGKVRAIRPGREYRIPERALEELADNAIPANDNPLAGALALADKLAPKIAAGSRGGKFSAADELNAIREERDKELTRE